MRNFQFLIEFEIIHRYLIRNTIASYNNSYVLIKIILIHNDFI